MNEGAVDGKLWAVNFFDHLITVRSLLSPKMAADKTQHQSPDAQSKARTLSLEPTRPPANIPGYALDNFLGRGTYGEVWRATDQKTGRRVAIKFYTQRSAADVQQLAQEVEKLVVLSADRYVVQPVSYTHLTLPTTPYV